MADSMSPHVTTARIVAGLLLAIGIATFTTAAFHTSPGEAFLTHYAALNAFIAENQILAIVAFASIYIVTIALCLPANVIMALTAGVLFGGLTGGTVAVLSSTLGGVVFFIALRAGFATSAARHAPSSIAGLMDGFKRDGFFYLLFLRVTPIFPFFIVNIAAALCGIRLTVFVAATLIGIAPVTFSYSFAAAGLEQAIAKQAEAYLACKAAAQSACPVLSPTSLIGSDFLLPLSVLGALTILPVLARRLVLRRA